MEITKDLWNVLVLLQVLIVFSTALGTILAMTFLEFLRERRRESIFKKYFYTPKTRR